MNELSADTLKFAYLGGSSVVAGFLAWNGWRQGVARQGMTLLGVASAYAAGFFGRKTLMPAFGFLGYPELVTELISGVAAGILTYIAINALSRMAFKRNKDVPERGRRIRSGVMGAALGLAFATLLFIASYYAIRMMGTLAASQVRVATEDADAAKLQPLNHAPLREDPGSVIRGLAKLNDALNEGSAGEILHKVDRIPPNVYATMFKLGLVVSREESLDRFLAYPGVAALAYHPKLQKLKSDPTVSELLVKNSYLRLLKNAKVVELANDAEFAAEIKRIDFEKALDEAIKGGALPMPEAPLKSPRP